MNKVMKENGNLNVFQVIKISLLISLLLAFITLYKNNIQNSYQSTLFLSMIGIVISLQVVIILFSIIFDLIDFIRSYVISIFYGRKFLSKEKFMDIKKKIKQVFNFKASRNQLYCVFRC